MGHILTKWVTLLFYIKTSKLSDEWHKICSEEVNHIVFMILIY